MHWAVQVTKGHLVVSLVSRLHCVPKVEGTVLTESANFTEKVFGNGEKNLIFFAVM